MKLILKFLEINVKNNIWVKKNIIFKNCVQIKVLIINSIKTFLLKAECKCRLVL